MKSGVCPKCGSDEVYVNLSSSTVYSNIVPISFFSSTRHDFYVCANCGYIENYIPDEKALRKIAQKWQRVGDLKKKRGE